MAEAKKKRVLKKPVTVREQASKQPTSESKSRRLKSASGAIKRPLSAAKRLGKKEYHPVKLPDNRVGRFMTAPRRVTPRFFREAWAELRQVTWPNRRETLKLTLAVFVFAIVLSGLIGAVDYGLTQLSEKVLLDK